MDAEDADDADDDDEVENASPLSNKAVERSVIRILIQNTRVCNVVINVVINAGIVVINVVINVIIVVINVVINVVNVVINFVINVVNERSVCGARIRTR